MIRHHLATCLENCQFARFPVKGERETVTVKSSTTVDLHCSCRMPEHTGDELAKCDSCGITATAWIFPVRCLVAHMFSGNVRLVVPVIASSISLCVYSSEYTQGMHVMMCVPSALLLYRSFSTLGLFVYVRQSCC